MLRKTSRFTVQARAGRLGLCAFVCMGAIAVGCSGEDKDGTGTPAPSTEAGDEGDSSSDGMTGSRMSSNAGTHGGGQAGKADSGAGKADSGAGKADSGSMTTEGSGSAVGASGDSGVGGAADGGMLVEAKCGPNDMPEKGLQGDLNDGRVNCGLTLLSQVVGGGSVQGSGHCAYVRTGATLKAYSLADPLNPVETDQEPVVGASESMRARTVEGRAVLVSGAGVYDVSNCEDMVKKGEIAWPDANMDAALGIFLVKIAGHEISISHDAKRVYGGVGFVPVNIENLDQPATWTVKNWTCELNTLSGFPGVPASACEGPSTQPLGRMYSHSSDDNLEGTVWYGANQQGTTDQMEPPTARMVDISDPNSIKILDTLHEFPGHSMNWWRTQDGREFIIGANEGLGFETIDTCMEYPRPTSLGYSQDAYIVEVTGNKFGKPFPLTLDVNKPENCKTAKAPGAAITEHTIYNENGAAFIMIEFGAAGLRVFDLRDGEHPREIAYYNDGRGYVHSGVFHYDASRGIMLASGNEGMEVLMLQPQMIAALGLPKPTDPKYPYK